MSGGVGPVNKDIRLPDDELPPPPSPSLPSKYTPRFFHLLSFRQLNAFAVIVVLAFGGLVSISDVTFLLFSFAYTTFIARFAFPPRVDHLRAPGVFKQGSKLLGLYVALGALIGIVAPVVYLAEGVVDGDREGVKAAAPHLFLLCSQVLVEGWVDSGRYSPAARSFVPVYYNARRVSAVYDWVVAELQKGLGHVRSPLRLHIGRALAVANLGFWCFNLFFFLLPVYLPRVMKLYYLGDAAEDRSRE
ncbi:uncharacterized protein LOC116248734 [Nymphaea colorata]|uniref:DUF7733 domain-containing protein n=1 Tax=Nymphaea colorata TaxID=210225 RepID=A0A5K1A8U3_9MAGN|nr:uncharacterized protein LOC116248734 [Nymphaea colorata]